MDLQETDDSVIPEKEKKIVSTTTMRSIETRLQAFIENYAQCGRVMKACKAAGINHNTHYRKLATDPAYRAAVEEAEQEVAQQVEDRVFDLAMEGELQAALMLLRRFRPKHYREHTTVDVTGTLDLVDRLTQARERMIPTDADTSEVC